MSLKSKFKNPNYTKIFLAPPLLVSKDFSLWLRKNELDLVKFGVIIPKKNVKMATDRNHAKRLAKELFKNYQQKFKGKDVVLLIKKPWVEADVAKWKKKLTGVYAWLDYFGKK